MTKVVYVTGCLGFIGSYVTRACLKKGWYVKGVDKMTYASNKDLLNEFKKYVHHGHISDYPEYGVECDMCSDDGENNPIINENEIRLNGCNYSKSAREPFTISIDKPGPSFCNTDKRPYDLLVCCSLLVFTGIFPDYVFSFSSDGEDRQWMLPIAQYQILLNKTAIMYFNKNLKLEL